MHTERPLVVDYSKKITVDNMFVDEQTVYEINRNFTWPRLIYPYQKIDINTSGCYIYNVPPMNSKHHKITRDYVLIKVK